nr:glycoside hydrolase N-terminal domain-containing protein [Paenibacillus sp. DCT19]
MTSLTKNIQPNRLWYRQPATRWEEALPIGNGRLGVWCTAVTCKNAFS